MAQLDAVTINKLIIAIDLLNKNISHLGGGGATYGSHSRTGGESRTSGASAIDAADKSTAKRFQEFAKNIKKLQDTISKGTGETVEQLKEYNEAWKDVLSDQNDVLKEISESTIETVGKDQKKFISEMLDRMKSHSLLFSHEIEELNKKTDDEQSKFLEETYKRIRDHKKELSNLASKNKNENGTFKSQAERRAQIDAKIKPEILANDITGSAIVGTAEKSIQTIIVDTINAASIISKDKKFHSERTLTINPTPVAKSSTASLKAEWASYLNVLKQHTNKDDKAALAEITQFGSALAKYTKEINEAANAKDNDKLRKAQDNYLKVEDEIIKKLQTLDDLEGKKIVSLQADMMQTKKAGQIQAFLSKTSVEAKDALIEHTKNSMGVYGKFASTAAAIGLIIGGLTKAYNDFKVAASSGLGGQFGWLSWNATKLGISIGDLTQVMTDNRDILVGFGGDVSKMSDTMLKSNMNLLQFGLVGKDATEATVSMMQAAKAFGVSVVNNQAGLNDSIAKQTKLFSKMSAITGISIKELAKQAAEMANSTEMQENLARLSVTERQGRMMDLMQQKQILIMQGMNAAKAQEILQTQERALKAAVKDRFDAAAKMMQLAGAAGMGAEGQEAAQIMMKGTRASAEERVRLQEILKNVSQASDGMMEGSLATENMMNELRGGIGGIGEELLKGGREQALVQQNTLGTGTDQKMLQQLTTIGVVGQQTLNLVERFHSMVDSWLGKILLGVTAIGMTLLADVFGVGIVKGLGNIFTSGFGILGKLFTNSFRGLAAAVKFMGKDISGIMKGGIGGGLLKGAGITALAAVIGDSFGDAINSATTGESNKYADFANSFFGLDKQGSSIGSKIFDLVDWLNPTASKITASTPITPRATAVIAPTAGPGTITAPSALAGVSAAATLAGPAVISAAAPVSTINTKAQATTAETQQDTVIKKLIELIDVNKQELELARQYYTSTRGNVAPSANVSKTLQAGKAMA